MAEQAYELRRCVCVCCVHLLRMFRDTARHSLSLSLSRACARTHTHIHTRSLSDPPPFPEIIFQ